MDINKYVGSKIRKYRKKKGLNQTELGKILGVAQNTVAGYEKGDWEVGYDNLFKLAELFGIKVDDLFPPTKTEGGEDILQRALQFEETKKFSIEDMNFLKKLTEKTLSMDEKEREKFLESIKFTVEYYERNNK